MIFFEKGEVPNDFQKTLIKPLYKKNDKSECRNHSGISLASVGSKQFRLMILFRIMDAVDKGFRKGKVVLRKVEDFWTKLSLLG